ncbi:glycosyltransferase family 2 protein [Acidomonas methanolica]|uniref:glycosyltransferase family 2 protein n=1 Tax=Acidomonas methanolica TaxID=437 RepID=UPI00211A958A|nr:glycosyltransferase family 2 protein [Acidomonas methanolica]MCQ9156412.1 glycosyltransferase family 2 protein [Acidomonas methanolica]
MFRPLPVAVALKKGRERVKIAVITMVYNEAFFLPFWSSYYGMQFGFDNLYIIDHGSNDGCTLNVPGNKIRLQRSSFDDQRRSSMISDLQSALLREFDVVIYTDCDEFLSANNLRYHSLNDYVRKNDNMEVIRAVGVDIMQDLEGENELDFSRSIMSQRRYGYITSWESKPLITRTNMRWTSGFHNCDRHSVLDEDLWLIHLKKADFNYALKRLHMTRDMLWSEDSLQSGVGVHQRNSDESFINDYKAILSEKISHDIDVLNITSYLEGNSSGPLGLVPERFKNF